MQRFEINEMFKIFSFLCEIYDRQLDVVLSQAIIELSVISKPPEENLSTIKGLSYLDQLLPVSILRLFSIACPIKSCKRRVYF